MPITPFNWNIRRESGVTLIELMVAMLIGMFLLLGSVTIITQSRANYRVSDSVARLQENARFAVDVIAPDVRLAKYWGRNNGPESITVPGGIDVTCGSSGANVTAWALNLPRAVRIADDDYTALDAAGNREMPCPPPWGDASARDNSDVLVLRHASGQPTNPTVGRIQVRTDLGNTLDNGLLFNDGNNPEAWGSAFAQTHDVLVNAYYVADRSDIDTTTPSLRMMTLGANGVIIDQELIAGVENLQVLLGVDTNGDNAADQYVDDHSDIAAGDQIVAVRLWMLLRTIANENAYVDIGPYATPDPDASASKITLGRDYPNTFRRVQVSRTILLRNNRSPDA